MVGISEEKLLTTHFMELFEDLDHRRIAELFLHSETVSQTIPTFTRSGLTATLSR